MKRQYMKRQSPLMPSYGLKTSKLSQRLSVLVKADFAGDPASEKGMILHNKQNSSYLLLWLLWHNST